MRWKDLIPGSGRGSQVDCSILWRILLGFGGDRVLFGRSADWICDRVGGAGRR